MAGKEKDCRNGNFIGWASVFWFRLIEALLDPDLRDQEWTPTGSMTTF
jgi:hypothetical protein